MEEVLATLLSGATLVLCAENRWTTRTAFQEFVQESEISALSVPTPFWSQWTHYLSELSIPVPPTLRVAATIGALPSPNADAAWRAIAGQTRLLHRTVGAGGPSLVSESASDDPLALACLGRPGPGMISRVVDSHGHALPGGLPGGLEIATRDQPRSFAALGIQAFVTAEGSFYDRSRLQTLTTGASPDLLAEAIYLSATHASRGFRGLHRAASHRRAKRMVPLDRSAGLPARRAARLPRMADRAAAPPRPGAFARSRACP